MVNPGHRSRGCGTCRTRRIKCDEARPTCSRCKKSKRTCLGYDSQGSDRPTTWTEYSEDSLLYPKIGFDPPLRGITNPLRPLWMQQSVAHFLENFTSNAKDTEVSTTYLRRLDMVSIDNGSSSLVISMLDVVTPGFLALRQLSQSNEVRLALHDNFCNTLRRLRLTLSSFPSSHLLPVSVFLLALYKMTTSATAEENAWQIHLEGLVSLLRLPSSSKGSLLGGKYGAVFQEHARTGNLCGDLQRQFSSNIATQPQLFLGSCLLRLKEIAAEMDHIFKRTERPRKLDVLKLHNAIKTIHQDLALLSMHLSPREKVTALAHNPPPCESKDCPLNVCSQFKFVRNWEKYVNVHEAFNWNLFRMMRIICCRFLIESGRFLEPTQDKNLSKKLQGFSRVSSEAATEICSSVLFFLGNGKLGRFEQCPHAGGYSIKTLNYLLLVWPLYVATVAPGISSEHEKWAKDVLCGIGTEGCLPQALALGIAEEEDYSYSKAIAGSLLLDLGFYLISG